MLDCLVVAMSAFGYWRTTHNRFRFHAEKPPLNPCALMRLVYLRLSLSFPLHQMLELLQKVLIEIFDVIPHMAILGEINFANFRFTGILP